MAHLRQFDTGATRDAAEGKPDYEGYMSPTVIQRFGAYMLAHQHTPEGMRASDNWQRGIPRDEYIKSFLRHTITAWKNYRSGVEDLDPWCAIFFNCQGFIHESLKAQLYTDAVVDPTHAALPYRGAGVVKGGPTDD